MDGLCGIYCLVHFLDRAPRISKFGRTKAHAAFAALLESAERAKLLTAAHITRGFYAEDLAEIFNGTVLRKRLPFRASTLETVAEKVDEASGSTLLRRIFGEGGAAIVSVCGGQHWVLAESIGDNTDILVRDSGHSARHRKDELKRVSNAFDGVALLPRRSSLAGAFKG